MESNGLKRDILTWGWTSSVFLLLSYVLCIGFGLVAPEQFHMHQAWAPLLPGFSWLTWQGFLAGAVGSFLYGWYFAVLLVPLYRYFSARTPT